MEQIRSIKGTRDILPAEALRWQEIEEIIHDFMELHGYGEIRTPAFEQTNLFTRGVGAETDIVSKEMYSWVDQGGESLTLKPELTAPVVRAFIQHNLAGKAPINRLYYIDSLFRRERPQKGRQRQFHQFGIEAFGSPHPEQDAEVIAIAYKIWGVFGIDEITLHLNSIGSPEIRPEYIQTLRDALATHADKFCHTCNNRLKTNALRVFDCKSETCQYLLDEHAPMILDHITAEDREHFDRLCELLDGMGIAYRLNKKMVRGLDYYTRTTFEITSPVLGAQNSLCGGGRYDRLVEQLGGKKTPAIGFAAGIERLLLALSKKEQLQENPVADIYMITLGNASLIRSLSIADDLRREKGLRVIVETLRRSLKAQLREANRCGANYAVILGDNELVKNIALVKNMKDGEQLKIPLDELEEAFTIGTEHHHTADES